MLDTTGQLISLFNLLPSPIRESVAVLGQMALVLAGLRKFGATDRFVGGPLGFLANPDKRLKNFALKGLGDANSADYDELQSSSRRAHRAATAAGVARQQAQDFQSAPGYVAARRLPEDHPDRVRVEARRFELEKASIAAESRLRAAIAETNLIKQGVIYGEQQRLALERVDARNVRAHLAAQNVAIPASLDPQNTRGVRRIARNASDAELAALYAAGDSRPVRPDPADRLIPVPQPTGRERLAERGRQRDAALRATTGVRTDFTGFDARAEALEREAKKTGRLARQIGSGSGRVANAAAQAVTFMGAATDGVRRAGGGLAGFARGLGGLNLALLGVLAVDQITNQTDKLGATLDKSTDFAKNYTGKTQDERDKLAARARRVQRTEQTDDEYRDDALGDFGDFFKPADYIRRLKGTYVSDAEKRAKYNASILVQQEEQEARERDQADSVRKGIPRKEVSAVDLLGDIKRTGAKRRDGLLSLSEFDRQMAVYAQEAKLLLKPTKDEQAKVQAALAAGGGSRASYAETVRGLSGEGLAGEIERLTAEIEGVGAGKDSGNLKKLGQVYKQAARLYSGNTDLESITALNEAREATFKALQENAEAEIEAGLQSATTEGGRRGVFTRALARIARLPGAPADLRRSRDAEQAKLDDARRRRDAAQDRLTRAPQVQRAAVNPVIGAPITLGFPTTNAQRLQADATRTASEVRQFSANVRRFKRELKAAERRMRAIDAQIRRESAFDDRQAGRDIDLAYRQSMTIDPVQRAVEALRAAEGSAKDSLKTFGKGSSDAKRKRKEQLTAVNNSRNEVAEARKSAAEDAKSKASEARQEAIEHARLVGDLAAARAGGDPVLQAKAQIASARAGLASGGTRNERLQSLIDLANANTALEQALAEREGARFDLLASQTEDPYKQAVIGRRRATYDLKHATGPTDKLQKRAAYNRAIQDERNAKIADRKDNIDFDLAMGKITTDAAATLIRSLAKTKGLAKKAKRDLLLEAKRLNEEASGDYELNLDTLRLPSLYEIRRAVVGGQQGSSITNQYRTEIHVADPQSALRVGEQMEQYHTGSLRAMSRATGRR